MKIEVLNHWTLKAGLSDKDAYWQSAWLTGGLCAVIIASLMAIIYVKYENHRLYSEISKLEARTHSAYREHQVISSQRMRNISYDSVQMHIMQNNMVISY